MQSVDPLIARLSALLLSKSAVSFYINGGPGVGKSYLLETLVKQIPSKISGTFVVGPNKVNASNVDDLVRMQMQSCLETGFLENLPPSEKAHDIASAWCWLGQQELFSPRQVFVVLVDLDSDLDLPVVASLFSRARYLETAWNVSGASLLYIFVGSWDPVMLATYCDSIGVSFPYTPTHNYIVWEGIDSDTMTSLTKRVVPDSLNIHGHVLFELTGGHPTVACEILEVVGDSSLSIENLLDATYTVAKSGKISARWLAQWPKLSSKSQEVVRQLLYQRYALDPGSLPHINQLLMLGIVHRRMIGNNSYLGFRSWYMELLFRLHLEDLGIYDEQLAKIELQEMTPPLVAVNKEAYEVISDVENNVRNFVALWLCGHKEGEEHILSGRHLKYISDIDEEQDAYERAIHWQEKSRRDRDSANLNPLLTYFSTRDLAELIEEIERELKSSTWRQIAQSLRQLANVRDAVMHNQLIDDKQLRDLYMLQAAVLRALTQQAK